MCHLQIQNTFQDIAQLWILIPALFYSEVFLFTIQQLKNSLPNILPQESCRNVSKYITGHETQSS